MSFNQSTGATQTVGKDLDIKRNRQEANLDLSEDRKKGDRSIVVRLTYTVTRKRFTLHNNLVLLFIRLIETRHEEMQVGR